jgi:prephenate dehydratase
MARRIELLAMSTLRISYQGEPGAFSEQAAHAYFGPKIVTVSRPAFHDIFEDVVRRRTIHAVVPIENSVYGSVHQNYDLLQRNHVYIIGELKLRISLQLLALHGVSLRGIREVFSHPQALGQCDAFLRSLKNVVIHPYYDTAGAAKMIGGDKRRDAAAIASVQSARHYHLSVLRRDVEDDKNNFTRFLIIGRTPSRPKRHPKTSIIFAAKNIPGALFKCLAVFALRNINLMKIESRPIVGKPWQYLFYADIASDGRGKDFLNALQHLQELTTYVKNLGSYETGDSYYPSPGRRSR